MKLNILVAYPYFKKDILDFLVEKREEINLLVDSGAFTAWKSGKPIKISDYYNFLSALPFEPFGYFNLDNIDDPRESFLNYDILRRNDLNPIPVFTRGEDPKRLEEYYETSEVVGIGGLVGTPGNKGYVKGIMEIVKGRKVHWLGFTSGDFIIKYSPHMCDCSSWNYCARYGYLLVYNFKGGFDTIYRKQFVTGDVPKKILTNIRRLGIDPVLLLKEESWRGGDRTKQLALQVTARGYVRKSFDAKKLYNTNMFLACSSLGDAQIVYDAYNYVRKGF